MVSIGICFKKEEAETQITPPLPPVPKCKQNPQQFPSPVLLVEF